MVDEFKGLYLVDLIEDELDRAAVSSMAPTPEVQSWRRIGEDGVRSTGQFLWTVRPPGVWVTFTRLLGQLYVSSAVVPLNVDYEAVYEMLGQDKAVLLARCSDDTGLIAVAVKAPDQQYLPLMPGFTAGVVVDPTSVTPEGTEQITEKPRDWPEGLEQPEIIHMQTAHSLLNTEHRQDWLKRNPEGLWLITVVDYMRIYEVLS